MAEIQPPSAISGETGLPNPTWDIYLSCLNPREVQCIPLKPVRVIKHLTLRQQKADELCKAVKIKWDEEVSMDFDSMHGVLPLLIDYPVL